MGSGPKGGIPAFVQSLCTYHSATEAIHNPSLMPLPAHPTLYPISSLCLCLRNHIKHKHFKIESESLNISAELPKWYWYYPVQTMRMIKGRKEMYGRDYTQPQKSGITVDLEDTTVLSQHITVSQVYRKQYHLHFTLACRTMKLFSFPVTTPSCPLIPIKVSVLG